MNMASFPQKWKYERYGIIMASRDDF